MSPLIDSPISFGYQSPFCVPYRKKAAKTLIIADR